MTPSLPPMPQGAGQPGQPPPQAPPPAQAPGQQNISPLSSGQDIQPTGPTPDQRVSGYMEQVRNLSIQIDALAGQFPDAAQDLNNAKVALVNSMSKVATAMSQPSGATQPPTF